MRDFRTYREILDNGSYLCLTPSDLDKSSIYSLCLEMGIQIPDVNDLHCTLMYSPEVGNPDIIPDYTNHRAVLGDLKLFGPDKDYLVVEVTQCPSIVERHRELLEYGLIPTYPEYRPHISLVPGGFKGEIPQVNTLKGMHVTLGDEQHTPLDPDR